MRSGRSGRSGRSSSGSITSSFQPLRLTEEEEEEKSSKESLHVSTSEISTQTCFHDLQREIFFSFFFSKKLLNVGLDLYHMYHKCVNLTSLSLLLHGTW